MIMLKHCATLLRAMQKPDVHHAVTYTEPEIIVRHWIISYHFWQLSDQKSVCSDKVSGQSDNKDNIISVSDQNSIMSEQFWDCSDILTECFKNLISATDTWSRSMILDFPTIKAYQHVHIV